MRGQSVVRRVGRGRRGRRGWLLLAAPSTQAQAKQCLEAFPVHEGQTYSLVDALPHGCQHCALGSGFTRIRARFSDIGDICQYSLPMSA